MANKGRTNFRKPLYHKSLNKVRLQFQPKFLEKTDKLIAVTVGFFLIHKGKMEAQTLFIVLNCTIFYIRKA